MTPRRVRTAGRARAPCTHGDVRDNGNEMILPALEIYTQGLMTDAVMYDAFVAKQEAEKNGAPEGPVTGA